jgi:2-polyprenyl-6-methoxyphenol hydroxylase-like FAD-dependent oxidoreductase
MGYDVLVIGYGPAGMVLSALLGQRGRRVAVIERYAGLYNLPRAATFDDDAMRLLQKLGIAESVAVGTRVQRTYDWCNAEGSRRTRAGSRRGLEPAGSLHRRAHPRSSSRLPATRPPPRTVTRRRPSPADR